MAVLTDEQKKQIEERIRLAETKTRGEIVVSTVPSSGDYSHIHWLAAAIGAAIATGILFFDYYRYRWGFTPLGILGWQTLGGVVGGVLSLHPVIGRLLVSRRTLASHVHHECLAHFTALGMSHTRDHTGILIFLSEFEHRVEILADRGIHEKTGNDYWREQVRIIVAGLKSGKPAEAIGEAIDHIGEKLAAHFPPIAGDTDELTNRVRDRNQIPEPK